MPRLTLTLTKTMHDVLKAESEQRGIPIAYIIREYLAKGLAADGKPIADSRVTWGGLRTIKKDNRKD